MIETLYTLKSELGMRLMFATTSHVGASWLSWGLVKGAEFTGKAIHKGASKLREHITPEDKPAHVSPTVTRGLHVAKQATGGAVKVSQFLGERSRIIGVFPRHLFVVVVVVCLFFGGWRLTDCRVTAVDGVCAVASCVGRELAPHVKKHGGKLIPESMRKDKDGRSNIDGAMVVAASGVQGRAVPTRRHLVALVQNKYKNKNL